MVTVSKKIRITDLTNFPVSVGEQPTGIPATGAGGYPYYYQPYPNYPVGIPGTDTSGISDPITDPHPGSCDAGYVKDSNGYCVPIISLPACPTGQARDVNTGLCVTTTTTPPPTTSGIGLLASATVPPSSVPGESITILVSIKNTASVNSYNFGSRIRISSLTIDIFSPLVAIQAGQTVMVTTNLTLPNTVPVGAVAGTIDVIRQVSTVPASVVIDDTEPFTLNIVTNVPYPCSSLPACLTGYHRDSACNCVSDTPPTGTATIVPSATTVAPGPTISVVASGFAPSEMIDFVAKIGTTIVTSPDAKAAGSTGGVTLSTLTFLSNAPTGTATITATGRTSGRVGIANVTVTGTPGPTPGTAVITVNKSSYKKGDTITISGNGFQASETVQLRFRTDHGGGFGTKDGPKNVKANSTGGISGTLKAVDKSDSAHCHVKAEGLTSHRIAYKYFAVT